MFTGFQCLWGIQKWYQHTSFTSIFRYYQHQVDISLEVSSLSYQKPMSIILYYRNRFGSQFVVLTTASLPTLPTPNSELFCRIRMLRLRNVPPLGSNAQCNTRPAFRHYRHQFSNHSVGSNVPLERVPFFGSNAKCYTRRPCRHQVSRESNVSQKRWVKLNGRYHLVLWSSGYVNDVWSHTECWLNNWSWLG